MRRAFGPRSSLSLVLCFLLASTAATAANRGAKKKAAPKPVAASEAPKVDAAAAHRAFERLKTLEGKWTATSGGKTTEAVFDVVAGKTAVMQRSGFLSVFYLEDGALVGISFTDDGNQPRLRSAEGLRDGADAISFDLAGISNLKSGAGHLTGVTLRFVDADRLVQTLRWREGGKDSSFETVFVRNSASTLK